MVLFSQSFVFYFSGVVVFHATKCEMNKAKDYTFTLLAKVFMMTDIANLSQKVPMLWFFLLKDLYF